MIKTQKDITIVNACGAHFSSDELIKAMLWYSHKPIMSQKRVFMHGEYPAVSMGGEKIHIHRLLMMFWLKTVLPSDYFVHHINHNKLNAEKENLSLVFAPMHQSHHNEGKSLTENHRKKISEKNRLRKGTRYALRRTDVSPQLVYQLKSNGMSFNQISIKYKIDWGCVKQRYDDFIHDNPELLEVQDE